MAACSISRQQFVDSALKFLTVSAQNIDFWEFKKTLDNQHYLEKRCTRSIDAFPQSLCCCSQQGSALCEEDEDEDDPAQMKVDDTVTVCSFEYHVVYSESYGVPVLYFNGYHRDGSLLSLEEVWSLVPAYYQDLLQDERWAFITQQEHPLLGRPFFYLHPCHTASLMDQVFSGQADKQNYVLSWLSSVGPVVGLQIPLTYGTIASIQSGDIT